jgi:hypothetical protein
MDMLTLTLTLLGLLAAVGMSHLFVDGTIFDWLRKILIEKYKVTRPWVLTLISCYQCTGFWTGALMGLFLQPISWGLFDHLWWFVALLFSLPLWLVVTPFIFGCAASYLSMAAAAFLNYLDAPAIMAAEMRKKKNEQPQA